MKKPITARNTDRMLEPLRQALDRKEKPAPRPGQIWKARIDEHESRFVVLTTRPLDTHPSGEASIRACPLNVEYQVRDVVPQDDLVMSAQDSTLGLPFLIETWNELPLMQHQLMFCLGTLSESLAEQLRSRFADPPEPLPIPGRVRQFRHRWILEGRRLSEPYFAGLPVEQSHAEQDPWEFLFQPANENLALAAAAPRTFDQFAEVLKRELHKRESAPNRLLIGPDGCQIPVPPEAGGWSLVLFDKRDKELARVHADNQKIDVPQTLLSDWGTVAKIRLEPEG